MPADAAEPTLPRLLLAAAGDKPNRVAYGRRSPVGHSQLMTWQAVWGDVERVACALRRLGLQRGDRLAMIARTRIEWQIAELAGQLAGGIIVGIDPHAAPEQQAFMLGDAGARMLIVDSQALLEKIPKPERLHLEVIVTLDDEPVMPPCLSWRAMIQQDARWSEPFPAAGDPAVLLYTAGTTGAPKGIIYSHAQILAGCRAIDGAFPPLEPDDAMVCWLPMSHLFQRMANVVAMQRGVTTYFVDDPRNIMTEVRSLRPAVFIGVPRFYEKLYDGIQHRIEREHGWRKRLLMSAIASGVKHSRQSRTAAGSLPSWKHVIFDWLVLRQIRKTMGGRIKFMIAGSAPTPAWLLEYLHGVGWLVLEAYGMSENTVPIAMNRPEQFRFGAVGRCLPGTEVRVAADGEILVKGPGLFTGYYNRSGETQWFTPDGFYRSGDYGQLDAKGFLYLSGRRGDIIKTSTGRRIAPVPIETVYRRCAYIDQVVVFGEGHPHLVALVTLRPECMAGPDEIRRAMRLLESDLAAYERVCAIRILPRPFSIAAGELTATLKLRRQCIANRYAAEIEDMYRELERRAVTRGDGT